MCRLNYQANYGTMMSLFLLMYKGNSCRKHQHTSPPSFIKAGKIHRDGLFPSSFYPYHALRAVFMDVSVSYASYLKEQEALWPSNPNPGLPCSRLYVLPPYQNCRNLHHLIHRKVHKKEKLYHLCILH